MEKGDFRYSFSFGKDVFGGLRWRDLVGPELTEIYIKDGSVMLDPSKLDMTVIA
jgi:hypothetical protein